MPPALALAVLDERRGSPLAQVIPSMLGEPLLWPGLDALLARCADLGLTVNVTTNGTFPGRGPEGWGEALLPVASDVKVSWNGASAATAERIMAGLDFERAVEGVRRFAAVRDRVARTTGRRATLSFQVTAQEGNLDELPDIVRLAARLGVDRIKVNHLQVRTPALAARSLRRSPEAIARWNAVVAEVRAAAAGGPFPSGRPVVLQNVVPLVPDPAAPSPAGPCPFAGWEAWIHWDGRFGPCPHPAAAEGGLGDFGSVADVPLGRIWASEPFRRFVAGHLDHPVCRACAFRRVGGA
jgi:MoaA/NifB/PqqE/SkfB family radical SAM enzyme